VQAPCFLSLGITLARPADDDWFESDNSRTARADSSGNQIARLRFGSCCSLAQQSAVRTDCRSGLIAKYLCIIKARFAQGKHNAIMRKSDFLS